MYAGNADSIKIESEENGFHMIVETDEGTFSFLIHGVAVDLLRQVKEQIQPWWAEGQIVLAEMKRASAFRCSPEDVDESGGYAPDDPKSEGYYDRMASGHDDHWKKV